MRVAAVPVATEQLPSSIVRSEASGTISATGKSSAEIGRDFRAIVAEVPFVDCLTTILDPALPLTVTEWEEWGNPIEDPAVYEYMKSYTPYENVPVAVLEGGNDEAAGDGSADGAATGAVAAAQFPRIFITTSMNDTRVLYVEPLKWLARLQSAGVDAVAKIEVEAGHGGLSGRYKQWEEVSYENAWCLSMMGIGG